MLRPSGSPQHPLLPALRLEGLRATELNRAEGPASDQQAPLLLYLYLVAGRVNNLGDVKCPAHKDNVIAKTVRFHKSM